MLQSSMWPQLARLKVLSNIPGIRTCTVPTYRGPVKYAMKAARYELQCLPKEQRHFLCGGIRSIGIALHLLVQNEIIAVPTDTVYGLAGLVNEYSIEEIYSIKGRDRNKPLAICVNNVNDVKKWGVVDDLPPGLLVALLPGQCTIILRRTPALDPALNPGIENVAIRVPQNTFIRRLAKYLGPLALTSANESDKPSSLTPDEFSNLWPKLGGVFHSMSEECVDGTSRIGSTIIDLSRPGHFSILRNGLKAPFYIDILTSHGLKMHEPDT